MTLCAKNPLRSLLIFTAVLAALALAACGSDDGDGGDDGGSDPVEIGDLTAAAPADSLVYVDGSVAAFLDGDSATNQALNDAVNRFAPEIDVAEALQSEVDGELSDEGFSFADDIEPWLGSAAGFFLTEIGEDETTTAAAAIVEVTDVDAANTAIDSFLAAGGEPIEPAEYEGVEYKTGDGAAIGFVGENLVVGTVPGFEAAVDASGDSLAGTELANDLAPFETGTIYRGVVDGEAVLDALVEQELVEEDDLELLGDQLEQFTSAPIGFSGSVSADEVKLSFNTPTVEGAEQGDVSGLPAGSWLAFVFPELGKAAEAFNDSLANFQEGFGGAAGLDGQLIEPPDVAGAIEDELGFDPAEELAWAGDLSAFVRGTSILSLGGGIVIETDDEDAAKSTVDKLKDLAAGDPSLTISDTPDGFRIDIAGAPVGAEVAVADGRVVIAAASVTVDEVLNPEDALSGDAKFGTASSAIGEGATAAFYLDFETVVDLLQSAGLAADPSFTEVLPYLTAIDYLIAGSAVEGGRTDGSLVIGLKESESTSSDTSAAAITP